MAEREGLLRFTPFYLFIRFAHRRAPARLSLGRRTLFSRVQILLFLISYNKTRFMRVLL